MYARSGCFCVSGVSLARDVLSRVGCTRVCRRLDDCVLAMWCMRVIDFADRCARDLFTCDL